MLELDVRPPDTLAARPSAELRPLEPEDWPVVSEIYWDGMRDGLATFETEVPSWDVWDGGHLQHHRLVAEILGEVVGFAALAPVSNRRCYAAVAENTVYFAHDARGLGIGRALLEALIAGAEEAGIWTIQTSIFPENGASLALHERLRLPFGREARAGRQARRHLAGHVGVTVIEAVGHGRQRGITHEYRGRIFESRFLPKALLILIVEDDRADAVVTAIADAARTGNEAGDGIVWTSAVQHVTHNRTGLSLEEVEVP